MASYTSGAAMPEPEEFDYAVSHRPVPAHSVAHSSTTAAGLPPISDTPGRPRARGESSSAHRSESRRRGSLSSLLQRSTSNQHKESPPPLPVTRITQAHLDAAADPAHSTPSTATAAATRKPSGEGLKMLRKSSKQRKQREEEERLAREAAAQPPRLQSINPLPNLGAFGGEGARPDSYAIFNNQYPASHGVTANFSRPGTASAPPSHNISSTPPAFRPPDNAYTYAHAPPSTSMSVQRTNGARADNSFDRIESMAHRDRYSYASSIAQGSVSGPRRVRRRKDPTPFNILVVGAKNSGKTSFISFLRHSLALPAHKQPTSVDKDGEPQGDASKSSFTSQYLETDLDGERVGLTLWDSTGLEKHLIDLQLREMATFVESKFEETFVEEQKVMRSPGIKDTHIHCVFLVLDPVRLDSTVTASAAFHQHSGGSANVFGLDDELDLPVMSVLWGKTTVIPVIAKADTLTVGRMSFLKRAVWESMKREKLDPLEVLELEADDDEDEDALDEKDEDEDQAVNNLEDASDDDFDGAVTKSKRNGHNRQSSLSLLPNANGDELPYIPMSILSPEPYDLPPFSKSSKNTKIGRQFPWGFADPYNPEHCDFVRLRDSIFSEWRADLRELARTKWYENWRTSRLKNLPGPRQRVQGSISPGASVPLGDRTRSHAARDVSASHFGGAATSSRGFSSNAAQTGGIGMAVSPPGERNA